MKYSVFNFFFRDVALKMRGEGLFDFFFFLGFRGETSLCFINVFERLHFLLKTVELFRFEASNLFRFIFSHRLLSNYTLLLLNSIYYSYWYSTFSLPFVSISYILINSLIVIGIKSCTSIFAVVRIFYVSGDSRSPPWNSFSFCGHFESDRNFCASCIDKNWIIYWNSEFL